MQSPAAVVPNCCKNRKRPLLLQFFHTYKDQLAWLQDQLTWVQAHEARGEVVGRRAGRMGGVLGAGAWVGPRWM